MCGQELPLGRSAIRGRREPELWEALPSPLASSLERLTHEPSALLALWAGCDLVESTLRLVVAGLAGEHLAAPNGDPTGLAESLRDQLEAPTLEGWLVMALRASERAVHESLLELEALPRTLEPLLRGHAPTPSRSFLAIRAALPTMTPAEAERWRSPWELRLRTWAERCLAPLAGLALVGVGPAGARTLLRGPWTAPLVGDLPMPRDAPEGSAWLCTRTHAVPLDPLADFDVTHHAVRLHVRRCGLGVKLVRDGEEPVLCDASPTTSARFREVFVDLGAKTAIGIAPVPPFDDEVAALAKRRVGRASELDTLCRAVKACDRGVVWLPGASRRGKSTLLAALAKELEAPVFDERRVFFYRFRRGDPRLDRAAFVLALARFLGGPEVFRAEIVSVADLAGDVTSLVARAHQGDRAVLLLDGLDAILERDPSFVDEVVAPLAVAPFVVVATGRPEARLDAAFARLGALLPFSDGLPTPSGSEALGVVLDRTVVVRERLLRLEATDAAAARALDAIAALAREPLALELLSEALDEGRLTIDAPEAWPRDVDGFLGEAFVRARGESPDGSAERLLALLALSHDPPIDGWLGIDALTALLGRCGEPDADPSRTLATLRALDGWVRETTTSSGGLRYALACDARREWLLGSAALAGTLAEARVALANASFPVASDGGDGYLLHAGVQHLLDLDRTDEALAALMAFDAQMQRLAHGVPGFAAEAGWCLDWLRVRRRTTALDGDALATWDFVTWSFPRLSQLGEPPHQALFREAMDHGQDSPVTQAAEAFEASGRRGWPWQRTSDRPDSWRARRVAPRSPRPPADGRDSDD